MAKPPSPLVGFNNNVKHHGRIFHVQTEDSGVRRPHIVTHLFADGGRIIKSTRTDYSEHLGRADMSAIIRRLMKEQHKAMFIALRDGQLNDTIDHVLGPSGASIETEPARPASGKRRSRPPPTLPHVAAGTLPPDTERQEVTTAPVAKRANPTLTDLVLADLESARTRVAPGAPATAGAHSAAAARPAVKGTPVLGTPATAPRASQAGGRYAPSRPAAIFSPTPQPSNIFGGSSIGEQSLDEVILSYLAEDLEGAGDE